MLTVFVTLLPRESVIVQVNVYVPALFNTPVVAEDDDEDKPPPEIE